MTREMARRPRRAALPVAVLLLALVAAGCTRPPPPPPPADLVVATVDATTPVAGLALAPGASRNFELHIPPAVAQGFDVVYLELGGPGGVLELRTAGYWGVIASSRSSERFSGGTLAGVPQPVPGATALADTVTADASTGGEERSVLENRACLGPCVIFVPTGSTLYARVLNDGAAPLTTDLYLYGYDLQDDGEPQNDSRATAPAATGTVAGALETLADTDFWQSPGHAQVTVTGVAGGVGVSVVVVNAAGVVVDGPYSSGQSFEVYSGEAIRVRTPSNLAAAPARSTYFVETTALPGNPSRPPSYIEVTANNSGAALDSRTVPAGGLVEYRVSVPPTVRSRDVIYVEIDRALPLELRSSSNLSAYANSSSRYQFASGAAVRAPEPALTDQGVTVAKDCLGACIIEVPRSSSYFVRVRGGSTATDVTLYVYGSDLMDDTEPANNAVGTAPVLVTTASGAIETIGDVDVWRAGATGTVAFDTVAAGPALRLVLLDESGAQIPTDLGGGPFTSGQTFTVFAGESMRISATNVNQAAVAAHSSFFLEVVGPAARDARVEPR